LREAVQTGQAFAVPLTLLQKAAADDAVLPALCARLSPYADKGLPTLAQLREVLIAGEDAVVAPVAVPADADLTHWRDHWQDHVRGVLQHLISVHPARDPALAPVEAALASQTGAAALQDFNALPVETQKSLAEWKEKLRARVETDATLDEMNAHFTEPHNQGSAP
jgi:hypothetical protein